MSPSVLVITGYWFLSGMGSSSWICSFLLVYAQPLVFSTYLQKHYTGFSKHYMNGMSHTTSMISYLCSLQIQTSLKSPFSSTTSLRSLVSQRPLRRIQMDVSSCISGLNLTQKICKSAFPQTRSNELLMQSMHYSLHLQSRMQCSKLHSVFYPIAVKSFPSADLFFAISSLKSVVVTVDHNFFDFGLLMIHVMISDGGCNFSRPGHLSQ